MAILDYHHPWIFIFGILGNVVSFFIYLAPVPTFYRICREKSTKDVHSLPYLVTLFSSMLWFYYAFLKGDSLLVTINSFGCVVEMVYIAIFITYALRAARNSTIKLFALMNMGSFLLVILVVHFIPNDQTRTVVLGWICTTISMSVFAAPLSIVAQVVRTKSLEDMPFSPSLSLTLSAIMWFGYGFLANDWCIMIPNVVGFVLGLCQMGLHGYFRNKERVANMDQKLPEHVTNIPTAVEILPPAAGSQARTDEQQPSQLPEGTVEVVVSNDGHRAREDSGV